jgi:hypothetical protein
VAERHVRNNRLTAGAWDLYAGHRRRLHALLVKGATAPSARLCVLGAGNANDLELERLAEVFAEVHLVDLDPQALAWARARLTARAAARVFAHAPVDAAAAADEVAARLPGRFDLVVSDCLLTQEYWSWWVALGEGPALCTAVETALENHLATLAALAAPGGRCLVVTDAISSETYPLEELFPAREPAALLAHLARQGALFTGTSPPLLLRTLRRAVPGAVGQRLEPPWLWRLGDGHVVLVYALEFTIEGGGG